MNEDESIQELIDYFSVLTHQELARIFNPEKADALHKLYGRQFRIHYNNYKSMMTNNLAKRHGVNSLFLMALDDALMEIKASYSQLKESAINIYRAMLQEFFESEAQKLMKEPNPWIAFVEWVKRGNKINYDNEFFKVIEVQNDEKHYGFDIQRCFYFDILKESGRPELGPILCYYDNILADTVNKWIEFTRHETIASGDPRCTFRYEKLNEMSNY
jgi:hypothetical protein